MRIVQASVVVAVTLGCLSGSAAGSEVAARCAWSRAHIVALRGFIRADMDGDRRSDRLAVLDLDRLRSSCRFALRVELARGGSSYLGLGAAPRGFLDTPYPRLLALVALEHSGRPDALVLTGNGASAGFYRLVGLRDGKLAWLGTPNDRFGTGASRWALASDCWHGARSGTVVSSFAEPSYPRSGWTVDRTLSVLRGTRFRYRRLPVRHVSSLRELPEFRSIRPFPSCTIARARLTRR
jgi:hypothetical protein